MNTPSSPDMSEDSSSSSLEDEAPVEPQISKVEEPARQEVVTPTVVKKRKRPSLFFPILLILGGVLLLLNNLGAGNQDFWGTVLSLWPVLLIAIGLDSIWRGEGITGAVFFIGLGIVFLLNNLGYIQMSVFEVLLTVWPVLFIAIGIDLLIARRRSIWLNLLGIILIVAILAGSLWMAGIGLSTGNVITGDQIQVDAQGASSAQISILPGAGSLLVHELVGSDDLLAGIVPYSEKGFRVKQEISSQGDKAIVKIYASGVQYYVVGGENNRTWDIGINPGIPVELSFEMGAGETNIDLTGLSILNSIRHQMGVGQIVIVLPEKGNFTLKVDCAIGTVRIIAPKTLDIQLQADTGLVNRSLPSGFLKIADNLYTSPGFAASENQVKVEVDLAIGQVVILQK